MSLLQGLDWGCSFMKSIIIVISAIIFLTGCAMILPKSNKSDCDQEIPEQVRIFFDSSDKPKFSGIINDASTADSIIDGTNKEFFMDENCRLCSRLFGWCTKVKFEPGLLYENKSYLLIDLASGVRFSSFAYKWIVIRKSDGKIIRSHTSGANALEKIVYDEIFYFKVGYEDPRIHCMKIGE